MTDEELKPFIGKEVRVLRINGDVDVGVLGACRTCFGDIGYTISSNSYFDCYAEKIASIKLLKPQKTEKEPKPTIAKGFIEFNGSYVRADCIVAVGRYLCKDDKYRTRIEANRTEYFTDIPVDEIMAKITEALL